MTPAQQAAEDAVRAVTLLAEIVGTIYQDRSILAMTAIDLVHDVQWIQREIEKDNHPSTSGKVL